MPINSDPPTFRPTPHGSAAEPQAPKRRNQQKESFLSILSTLMILLIAPIIAILLTAFVFQSYQVDGPSMLPTLHNNDRLIVWKLPKTWARITNNAYIPNRGDIIVFTEPKLSELGQDPSKQLIKRVIGLPGDRVVVKDGIVTVYNSEHPNGFHPDTDLPYHREGTDTAGDINTTVGPGQVYVLGDNRENSLDSRTFQSIDARNIVGKLVIRLLPLGDMKRF
jgi:signal peptidase I